MWYHSNELAISYQLVQELKDWTTTTSNKLWIYKEKWKWFNEPGTQQGIPCYLSDYLLKKIKKTFESNFQI